MQQTTSLTELDLTNDTVIVRIPWGALCMQILYSSVYCVVLIL